MTCKDCFHYEACKDTYEINFELDSFDKSIEMQNYDNMLDYCRFFKAKDKVIHLPCKVGDTVWRVTNSGVFYIKVESIHCFSSGIWKYRGWNGKGKFRTGYEFSFEAIGKTVFLTKEEAEKALKELKENEG